MREAGVLLLSEAPLRSRPGRLALPGPQPDHRRARRTSSSWSSRTPRAGRCTRSREAADRVRPGHGGPGLRPQPVERGHEPADRRRLRAGARRHRRARGARAHAPPPGSARTTRRPAPDARQTGPRQRSTGSRPPSSTWRCAPACGSPTSPSPSKELLASRVDRGRTAAGTSGSAREPASRARRRAATVRWLDGAARLARRRVPRIAQLGGPPHRRGLPRRPRRLRRVGRAWRRTAVPTTSTGSCCAATSPTSPPAATPSGPSPARCRRSGATSRGRLGRGSSPADPSTRPQRATRGGPPATRAPAGRAHHPARRPSAPGGRRPDAHAARDDAVLELLYGSGVRIGELCRAVHGRHRPRRGVAPSVWGKGGKQRVVPLSEPAVARSAASDRTASRCLLSPAPTDALFVNQRGHPLTPR